MEPICVFLGGEKMISDTSHAICFKAHCGLAKEFVCGKYVVLNETPFEQVSWSDVYRMLTTGIACLIALWTSKQVTHIAATNGFLSCPSYNMQ